MQAVNSYDPLTLTTCISNDLNDAGVFIIAPLSIDCGATESIYSSYLPCRAAGGTEGADCAAAQFELT